MKMPLISLSESINAAQLVKWLSSIHKLWIDLHGVDACNPSTWDDHRWIQSLRWSWTVLHLRPICMYFIRNSVRTNLPRLCLISSQTKEVSFYLSSDDLFWSCSFRGVGKWEFVWQGGSGLRKATVKSSS